jgi:hypothetical protein
VHIIERERERERERETIPGLKPINSRPEAAAKTVKLVEHNTKKIRDIRKKKTL